MSKQIEVSDETWAKIKDVVQEDEVKEIHVDKLEDFVGKKLFFRTVTYHYVGKVEKVVGRLLELSTASWVADSGRFTGAIKGGTLDEIEPIGKMWLNSESLVDIIPWNHELPTEQS